MQVEGVKLLPGNYVYNNPPKHNIICKFLYFDGERATIKPVSYSVGGSENDYAYAENLFKIPIDENWLQNLGFEEVDKGQYHKGIYFYNIEKAEFCVKPHKFGNYLYADVNSVFKGIHYVLSKKIQFVSQLQNAYFSLEGEQLLL